MISFEQISKYHPKLESFDSIRTTFWEELYQLFKSRLIQEIEQQKPAPSGLEQEARRE